MEVWYLDTSAMAKLVRAEAETPVLRAWLEGRHWVLSDLHRTELRRSAGRTGPATVARAERLLAEAEVLRLDPGAFDDAGRMAPDDLRSLDALHIAAARLLGPDLAGIVAYDRRLADAAHATGIPVEAPG